MSWFNSSIIHAGIMLGKGSQGWRLLCALCCSHHLRVTCTLQAKKVQFRPGTRETHLILTPGLDILQSFLCSEFALCTDISVEGSSKSSLWVQIEVINYPYIGENLSQKSRSFITRTLGPDQAATSHSAEYVTFQITRHGFAVGITEYFSTC